MAWNKEKKIIKQKNKYNFDKLKIEFFRDKDYNEVKAFFLAKFWAYNQHIQSMTKWWAVEKKELIAQVKEEVHKEIKEELKKLYRPTAEELAKMYEANMGIIKWKLFHIAQNIKKDKNWNIILPDWLDIKEQEIIHRIIKWELFDLWVEEKQWKDTIQTIRII